MTMGPGEVAEQERIATSLVGHCLTGVTYVSLGVEGREQTWDGPGGDSVDFGIDLDFDGQPLSVGWIPPTGGTKGLRAAEDSLLGWRDLDANGLDVGNSSRWLPALASQLSVVRLDWVPWSPRYAETSAQPATREALPPSTKHCGGSPPPEVRRYPTHGRVRS